METGLLVFWTLFCGLFVPFSFYVFLSVSEEEAPEAKPLPEIFIWFMLLLHGLPSIFGTGIFGGMLAFRLLTLDDPWRLVAAIVLGIGCGILGAVMDYLVIMSADILGSEGDDDPDYAPDEHDLED